MGGCVTSNWYRFWYTGAKMGIRSRSYPSEVINSALLGYKGGYSQRQVGEVLKVPRTTVKEWIHDYRDGLIVSPVVPDHAHHWVLQEGAGAIVPGVCRICFSEREFPTLFYDIWTRSEEKWSGLSVS
jgi:hypothetical protein|tara:strand:+ start:322 stop:702 length:381 start_codon:yes stop_codon:yes gene_type:complete